MAYHSLAATKPHIVQRLEEIRRRREGLPPSDHPILVASPQVQVTTHHNPNTSNGSIPRVFLSVNPNASQDPSTRVFSGIVSTHRPREADPLAKDITTPIIVKHVEQSVTYSTNVTASRPLQADPLHVTKKPVVLPPKKPVVPPVTVKALTNELPFDIKPPEPFAKRAFPTKTIQQQQKALNSTPPPPAKKGCGCRRKHLGL